MSINDLIFYNGDFNKFYKNEGITRRHTVRMTPSQNGIAKKMNKTLFERAHCMI